MDRRTFLLASGATGVLGATGPSVARADKGPLRVQVLMFDGVEEQDWAGPVEVLGLAAKMGAQLEYRFVTTGAPAVVTGTYGSRVEVATGWSPDQADLLLVPGGGYARPDEPGVHQLLKQPDFLRKLAEAHASGVVMAGVCTGVMVLSGAGLTKGRPCTTHHAAKADLAAQGGKVVDGRVVDDGDLVTAGGITSGLDLALWLVEREFGAQTAVRAEVVLEYERRGSVWR